MRKAGDDSSLRRIVVACLFFAAAFAVRVLSWPVVLRDGQVQPAGSDAFYHLRRIVYSVENFPELLSRDPYLNFPHGGEVIWSPAFDWLLAALAWVFVGPGDADAVARLLVFAPPLIGAATVAALYACTARHFSPRAAAIAAGLLCVLPAHVVYSRLGAIDHHVAVALCTLWMLAAGLRLLQGAGRPWRNAVWLGVALGGSLLVWPGSLIVVASLQVALAARTLAVPDRDAALEWAGLSALVNGTACAVVLPFSMGAEWEVWGAFSPVVLSNFQPLYLAVAALAFGALALIWRRLSFAPSLAGRIAQATSLLALLAGVMWLSLPSLTDAALDAWGWLTKAEEFQALVAESAPLFSRGAGFEGGPAEMLLSRALYLAPFAMGFLAWSMRETGIRPRLVLVLWLATVLLLATLTQRRFMNSFSILHALVLGLACERAVSVLRTRLRGRLVLRRASALAAGLAAIWILLPISRGYTNDLANIGRIWRGEPARAVGTALLQATLIPVADWLRENSPETQGFLDASLQPEYSLLSAWGDGHLLTYVARRPEVQGNFGDDVGAQNFARAEEYFSSVSESRAIEVLEKLGARYVIAGRTGSGHATGYAPGSMWGRMYPPVREARKEKKLGQGPPTLSLVQHRLLHTSRPPPANSPRFPYYLVYERVEGARVVGDAEPGARVEAQLRVVTADDGELRFSTFATADAEGRYRLTLPYANDPIPASVRVGQSYRLASGGQSATLAVGDSSVRSGAEVEGPSFRRP
jgi:asparagine N-glycosylation enzyme membrane subunit Stt3